MWEVGDVWAAQADGVLTLSQQESLCHMFTQLHTVNYLADKVHSKYSWVLASAISRSVSGYSQTRYLKASNSQE
jgi:hypothetical protein